MRKEENRSLERYALILDIISRFPDGVSLTEIAALAQLPKGTTHRRIKALVEIGYVTGGNGRVAYRLGPRLLRMLDVGEPPSWIAQAVEPILGVLVREFGETAFLAKLVGTEVRSVAMVVPNPTDRSYVHPGRVMPPNAAASAKAIIAAQPEEIVGQILRHRRLLKYTPATSTDIEALKQQYLRVRRDGYALCADELDPGVMSIAVPVEVDGAGTYYSVGLVGLEARLGAVARKLVLAGLHVAAESIAKVLLSQKSPPARAAASRSRPQRQLSR